MTPNESGQESIDDLWLELSAAARVTPATVGDILDRLRPDTLIPIITGTPEPFRRQMAASQAGSTAQGILARDASVAVRRALAASTVLSHDVRAQLARDSDAAVRALMAQSPELHKDVLSGLVADEHPIVRLMCARRHDLRAADWSNLATDASSIVRAAVAANDQAPRSACMELLRYPGSGLEQRLRVARRWELEWNTLSTLLESDPPVLEVLASPHAPAEVLNVWFGRASERSAAGGSDLIRLALANNCTTSPRLLSAVWSSTQNYHVRLAVSAHPRAPKDIVSRILGSDDFDYRMAAIRTGNVSIETLFELARSDSYFEEERTAALERLQASIRGDIERSWMGPDDAEDDEETIPA